MRLMGSTVFWRVTKTKRMCMTAHYALYTTDIRQSSQTRTSRYPMPKLAFVKMPEASAWQSGRLPPAPATMAAPPDGPRRPPPAASARLATSPLHSSRPPAPPVRQYASQSTDDKCTRLQALAAQTQSPKTPALDDTCVDHVNRVSARHSSRAKATIRARATAARQKPDPPVVTRSKSHTVVGYRCRGFRYFQISILVRS